MFNDVRLVTDIGTAVDVGVTVHVGLAVGVGGTIALVIGHPLWACPDRIANFDRNPLSACSTDLLNAAAPPRRSGLDAAHV